MKLNSTNIETVSKVKILGTIITNTLTWNDNCADLVKKCNARMQLLRTAGKMGASESDLKHIYIQFIRPILEGSCQVWSGSLTAQNMSDLNRCQKSAMKLIHKNYVNYKESLRYFKLDTLENRFKYITLNFARNAVTHPKLQHLFPKNVKTHNMKSRNMLVYQNTYANTERYRKSLILYMQKLLNETTHMK